MSASLLNALFCILEKVRLCTATFVLLQFLSIELLWSHESGSYTRLSGSPVSGLYRMPYGFFLSPAGNDTYGYFPVSDVTNYT